MTSNPWTRRRLLQSIPPALAPFFLPRVLRAGSHAPDTGPAPFSRFTDVGATAGLNHPTFYGLDDSSTYILEVMGA